MNIAVIGNGGIGKTLIELLEKKKEALGMEGLHVKICAHLDSQGGIWDPDGIHLPSLITHNQHQLPLKAYSKGGNPHLGLDEVLKIKDLEVLIELTPTNKETGEPGLTHITKALAKGIHVITANKGPIMKAYHQLKKIAEVHQVQLWIGCTTGGALPSINGGLIDLAGAEINAIEGVLNGTTNFILEEMKTSGCVYQEALEKAQAAGIAEADPTLDVEGWDTAAKLLILSKVLMKEDKDLRDIEVEGITGVRPEEIQHVSRRGGKMKLVGRAEKTAKATVLTVKPEVLLPDHPLYGVDGKNKGISYRTDTLGELTIMGGASGLVPAAASVLRDLVNLHRGYGQ